MKDFKIFSGTANPPLAEKISKILKIPLGKIEIVRFADSEVRVRIEEEVADSHCFIIASLSNPVDTHLVEFCLIVDALKQNEAQKIIGVIPYYGYARQDKAHRPGEGVSARVMAKLIEAVGVDEIITIDLHSEAVASFFNIPVVHLLGLSVFLPKIKKMEGQNLSIVAPDAGGAKRAQEFAESLGVPMVLIEKKRNLEKLHTLQSLEVIGSVKEQICVIVDDVITGGGTVAEAAKLLKEKGSQKVIACATHADFIEGTAEKLRKSEIDKIYVSDTISLETTLQRQISKLEIVSVADLLAKSIVTGGKR